MEYFFAKREDDMSVESKVYLKDILFIETIKQTHYCRIVHKKGENLIYSNIKTLEERLDFPFLKCSSSVIVNVEQIIEIDKALRLFHFENNKICSYSQKYYTHIKSVLSFKY